MELRVAESGSELTNIVKAYGRKSLRKSMDPINGNYLVRVHIVSPHPGVYVMPLESERTAKELFNKLDIQEMSREDWLKWYNFSSCHD